MPSVSSNLLPTEAVDGLQNSGQGRWRVVSGHITGGLAAAATPHSLHLSIQWGVLYVMSVG